MEKVSHWIMGIVGVVLLSLTADIVLAEGRTKNYIKGIFALITLFVILSPVASLIKSGINFDFGAVSGSLTPDNQYLDQLTRSQLQALEQSIERKLSEKGCGGAKVRIFATGQTVNSVYVDITALNVAPGDYQKICDQIKKIVSQQLNIDQGMVIVYG